MDSLRPPGGSRFLDRDLTRDPGRTLITVPIPDFLAQAGTAIDWPGFVSRIQELNGIRSGDILIVMDANKGFLTEPWPIEDADDKILGGWHGGPTRGESEVPLMINFNYDGKGQQRNGFLNEAVTDVLDAPANSPRGNRHLTHVVVEIMSRNRTSQGAGQ